MRGTRPLVRGEAAAKQSQVNNDALMGFQCLSIALETQRSGHPELEHPRMIHAGECG